MMSTRGLVGFRVGGLDKLAYNHADSDPPCLGVNVLRELRSVEDWNAVRPRIESLVGVPDTRLVGDNDSLARAEIRRRFPEEYSAAKAYDWHDLFKPFQGTLQPYLDGRLSFMATANDFIHDSLHCGWAYIANLDSDNLEIWQGLQREPAKKDNNRYGDEAERTGYYPCAMVGQYALTALPSGEEFLSDLRPYLR